MVLNRNVPLIDSGFYYLKRAIELDPKDPVYHFSMAGFYWGYVGLIDHGVKFINHAIKLDPLDANNYYAYGQLYTFMGNYNNAEAFFNQAIQLRPADSERGNYLAYLIETRQFEAAEKGIQLRKLNDRGVGFLEALLEASQGGKEKALALISKWDERKEESFFSSIINKQLRAQLFILMRMDKESFITSDTIISKGGNIYLWMKRHPIWDPYHEDPEFKRLLAKAKVVHDGYLKRFGYGTDLLSE